jgi:cyanophycin synthetase
MQLRRVNALRGPNIWANFPVLEAVLELGEYDRPSTTFPGFNDRLMAWLPSMIEHRCSYGERGGFFQRLKDGTYPGHILEHTTLELQNLAGTPVGFGKARETSEKGVYKVVVRYQEEDLARECLQTAFRLISAAMHDQPFDVAAEVAKLRDLAHTVCLGPSTASIVTAAKARGIPVRRLNDGSLVQLGHGAALRRIVAAETDHTSAVAEYIAQDKELTKSLLRSAGVPVPEGEPVANEEEAWQAAQDIGVPVVVKPQYGNQGRGVAVNLRTKEQVVLAYRAAREEGRAIVVEKFAPGVDYRVLVVNGKVIAAARREPPTVVGDGKSTIRQLVDVVNLDPRRGDDHATVLSKIKLDDIGLQVLSEQGLTPDSIVAAGQVVLLRRNGNLSTGGTATDVTDDLHPAVAASAIDAARMVGLDIAGIDIVAEDIRCPLEEQGGVVVEVNACPGLRMHLQPSSGTPRPVGEAIVDMLFPGANTGRVPIAAVTGTNGKTTTVRLLSHLMRQKGHTVGMTCTDGIYLNHRRIDTGDCSGPKSARMVLANPQVEAAVLETARGGILREGLGFDRCDVAVVTNIASGDHLGMADIHTPEQIAVVKRCIVEVVPPEGWAVLNAVDPLTAAMKEKNKGKTLYFAIDEAQAVLAEHRAAGGRVAFVRDGHVIVADGPAKESETVLADLAKVPLTMDGKVFFQVENTLAAASAAWCLGATVEQIQAGLANFVSSPRVTPGRFNVLNRGQQTIIVDYGHNSAALEALVQTLPAFPHERRVIMYTAAGDRRDEDIVDQARIIAEHFDVVVIYEDQCTRGRADGEVIRIMREGFAKGSRLKEIRETRGEFKAIDLTLETLGARDLAIVQADQVDAAVKYVDEVVSYGKPVSHPTTPVAGTPAAAANPQPANPPSSPVLV